MLRLHEGLLKDLTGSVINQLRMTLSGGGLCLLLSGCTFPAPSPNHTSPEFRMEEFGAVVAQPDVYRGRAVRLAGRIVRVEKTEKGTEILADWLPFPAKGQYGPGSNKFDRQGRFSVLYPEPIHRWSSWQGNRFTMTGHLEGTVEMIDSFTGTTATIPAMVARCLHLWETGDNLWGDQPDNDFSGYPYRKQTYCTQNQEGFPGP